MNDLVQLPEYKNQGHKGKGILPGKFKLHDGMTRLAEKRLGLSFAQ